MNASEERALIAAIRRAAREEIMPRFRALGDGEVDTKKDVDDLVTVADTAAERSIIAAVAEILPDVTVIGEEGVSAGTARLSRIGEDGRCLIVDPIDGTWNFAHGISSFGVMAALTVDGVTEWAFILDPVRDDWVVARAGGGAWVETADGQRRQLRVAGAPESATDTMGLVALYTFEELARAQLMGALLHFRRTANYRNAATEYRLLAGGSVDWSVTGMLNPWDHAAGALILSEAGGVARLLDGRDYSPTLTEGRMLMASGETLWQVLASRFGFLA